MKINFDEVLKDLSGEPLPYKPKASAEERPFTLRDCAVNALLIETGDQRAAKSADPVETMKRYRLSQKIYGCKEPIALDIETIAMIKARIHAIYPALTYGAAADILDPRDTPEDAKK